MTSFTDVHMFVSPAGETFTASQTDQPNAPARLRVRWAGETLLVSIGWWPARELTSAAYRAAVEVGAAEAAHLQKFHKRTTHGRISAAEWKQLKAELAAAGRSYLPAMERALHSVLVHGVSKRAAARSYMLARAKDVPVGVWPEEQAPMAEWLAAGSQIGDLIVTHDDMVAIGAPICAEMPVREWRIAQDVGPRFRRAGVIAVWRRHGIVSRLGEPVDDTWRRRFQCAYGHIRHNLRAVERFRANNPGAPV